MDKNIFWHFTWRVVQNWLVGVQNRPQKRILGCVQNRGILKTYEVGRFWLPPGLVREFYPLSF